ncbi:hypothetical protein CEUSTIGMA_g3212.t1 [Chlamydomonas eustigma]|uniref:ATP-dependent (S)-NAD(P)H-hydrate dehydratase n=1 Tax=Chlamydomonas eustigma TaxID=1157962 RepID=A0A250WYJ9_9CHLO|nr:hypothetical protein CEUSTIGMA_g3212.t1 [Chlamydomonas eustigma]|eukprot:GAX75769.1 hypothetical protein CEUSTIGMA_g3212.t1 [Chlamydomonas eustigma]
MDCSRRMLTEEMMIDRFKLLVPSLSYGGSNYKGQHGKVGIVGGCREYTGAPFFAAASAAKAGADLCYVFCTESASSVIKSYSPELIVLPLLPETPLFQNPTVDQLAVDLVSCSSKLALQWLQRLSCLVVGPGLGDDPLTCQVAHDLIREARGMELPLIVDGSGINIISKSPHLVQGYSRCLLTPNISELGRIAKAVSVPLEGTMGSDWQKNTQDIAEAWGGPVVLSKGPVDIITDGKSLLECKAIASPKRCGGQGDVLAGLAGTYISWAMKKPAVETESREKSTRGDGYEGQDMDNTTTCSQRIMMASLAACNIMRTSSKKAYQSADRGMGAADILPQITATAKELLQAN